MENRIAGIFTVLAISALILFPKEFIIFSGTTLGKWMALMAIVVSTMNDWVYGVFTCALIVYYYQLDGVQAVLRYQIWEHGYEGFTPNVATEPISPDFPKYVPYSIMDAFSNYVYHPTQPEPDAETKLNTVHIHDVLHKYLTQTKTDKQPTETEHDRRLELEAKMRLPTPEDDWTHLVTEWKDTVIGWAF